MVAVVKDPRPLEFVHVARVNDAELKFWRLPVWPAVPYVDINDLLEVAGVADEDLAEKLVTDLLRSSAYAVFAPTGTGSDFVLDVKAVASFPGALVLIHHLRIAGYGSAALKDQFIAAIFDACRADVIEKDPPSDLAALNNRAADALQNELDEVQGLVKRRKGPGPSHA